jgi:tetratricopeptide (TPR) repeat protein
MLTYDLQKAIKLCKALLLVEKQNMPNSHVKLFQFNLANAYLLSGNYEDAKDKYEECLESNPQGKLKAYLYNNLGLAYWWHKN